MVGARRDVLETVLPFSVGLTDANERRRAFLGVPGLNRCCCDAHVSGRLAITCTHLSCNDTRLPRDGRRKLKKQKNSQDDVHTQFLRTLYIDLRPYTFDGAYWRLSSYVAIDGLTMRRESRLVGL